MTFAQTHDTLWYSPKFGRLSFAARGLWVTCQSWCAGQLTDGLIPEKDVKDIGGSETQIHALVKSGLWEVAETEDGERAYQFHDWLDHNESAEKVSTKKRKERERKAAQRAKKSDPDLTQTSGESGGSFSARTLYDQPRSESVPGGKETEQKRTGTEHTSPTERVDRARPSGGSPTPTKTESKAEDEGQETTSPPNLSDPRFSPDTLETRFSYLQGGRPVVDVAATEAPATSTTSGDKPLEQMNPAELLGYIETFQREVNEIQLSPGGAQGVATLRRFQNDYGAQRAAAIIRELFVENQGHYKVNKDVETITHRHFSTNLRWFTDKIDINLQSRAKSEADVEREFIFASSL